MGQHLNKLAILHFLKEKWSNSRVFETQELADFPLYLNYRLKKNCGVKPPCETSFLNTDQQIIDDDNYNSL